MSHRAWPPSVRRRTSSILMVILAATGYRRWLSRPWQWSLRDYMLVVAVCAAGLVLSGCPASVIVFFSILAVAVYTCLSLARHGFTLADVATLLAIILLAAASILPAMQQASNRTLGTSSFPFAVPARYTTLFFGPE
jgi:hypothetical protein